MTAHNAPLNEGVTRSLRAKVRTGLLWTTLQSWGGRLSLLGLFAVVTRVLSPTDIGLFAMSSVVLALLMMLADQGLMEAVIQTEHITQAQMNSVFWMNMASSLVIVAIFWVSAPFISLWLEMPQLSAVMRVVALGLPITAASFGQMAMRKRAFEYRRVAMISLSATVLGCAAALVMVLRGYGVWSLVAQSLISTSLLTALLWFKPVWRLSLHTDFPGTVPLMKYGLSRISAAILEFINSRYIEFALAATLGPVMLAIYTVGVRLPQALMQALGSASYEIAHNSFSRLAPDRPALINAYYKALTTTTAIAVPVFLLTAAVAGPLTITAFGERWVQSAHVTRVMCVLGVVQLLVSYNGTLYNAIGRPAISLYFTVLKVVLTVAGLLLASDRGMSSLLVAYFFSQVLTAPLSFYAVHRLTGASMAGLARRLGPFLLGALLMTACAYGTVMLLVLWSVPSLLTLIIASAVGGVVYPASIYFFAPESFAQILQTIRGTSR